MAWLTLPDLIFSDIMMMVGLESLQRCRQVCSTWNEMILSDIWESPRKKKIMKERNGSNRREDLSGQVARWRQFDLIFLNANFLRQFPLIFLTSNNNSKYKSSYFRVKLKRIKFGL